MPEFDNLSLAELLRLQDELSQVVTRRFQRGMALAFSDIVGSTAYFARFGNEAGGKLQQRHLDFLQQVLPARQGQIANTAGDGALSCFPSTAHAVDAMIAMQNAIAADNMMRERDHQTMVRVGIHYGPVLIDGGFVTGDAVNLCARITATALGAEIRLTHSAFNELPKPRRVACQPLPPAALKGITEEVSIYVLEWRDISRFPTGFVIQETGQEVRLPEQDIVSCGRLREHDGALANDIVLTLPDRELTQRISRWHLELRRGVNGLYLRQVSEGITEVNDKLVGRGQHVQIHGGDTVRVGRVMTLTFVAAAPRRSSDDTTLIG